MHGCMPSVSWCVLGVFGVVFPPRHHSATLFYHIIKTKKEPTAGRRHGGNQSLTMADYPYRATSNSDGVPGPRHRQPCATITWCAYYSHCPFDVYVRTYVTLARNMVHVHITRIVCVRTYVRTYVCDVQHAICGTYLRTYVRTYVCRCRTRKKTNVCEVLCTRNPRQHGRGGRGMHCQALRAIAPQRARIQANALARRALWRVCDAR